MGLSMRRLVFLVLYHLVIRFDLYGSNWCMLRGCALRDGSKRAVCTLRHMDRPDLLGKNNTIRDKSAQTTGPESESVEPHKMHYSETMNCGVRYATLYCFTSYHKEI